MLKPNESFLRSYALDLLANLRELQSINKEKLFADALAFYRWQFSHIEAEEALLCYQHEFTAQHGSLVSNLPLELWYACFITWFVEQRFHLLPPLTGFDPHDQWMTGQRFTLPSFHLPTGDPAEGYLFQWLFWHIDRPRNPAGCRQEWLVKWATGFADEFPDADPAERAILIADCRRFFAWCHTSLRTWETYIACVAHFHTNVRGAAALGHPAWEACFVHWFCACNLDREVGDCQDNENSPERPGEQ